MWFWIRNISLLVLLLGLAYGIMNKPDFFIRKESVNAAAKGLSEFYASIRSSIADGADKIGDFKIRLPDTSDKLTKQLEQRSKIVVPGEPNWRGAVTDRRFRKGETVKTKLTDYARAEGLELFWTLPRDYVIKQYFQTDTSFINTVHEISQAIAPDFSSPVLAYYCPRERAAVITDKANDYLLQNCIKANTPQKQS
jgi:hypothetical protein